MIKHLGISLDDVIFANPFFQRKTKLQAGCQIDLLIQTKYNSLYVCEIKFSKTELSSAVIKEVQEKITRLKVPKKFSCRPILIHANGMTTNVKEKKLFCSNC